MRVSVKKLSFNPNPKFVALVQTQAEFLKNNLMTDRKFLGLALAVFLIGLFSGYTANAAVTPSQEDWDAYAQLKPVKKMNYDKIYDEIEADVNRLSVKEERFAVNLPLQLGGPMKAMRGKKLKPLKKTRRNARYR